MPITSFYLPLALLYCLPGLLLLVCIVMAGKETYIISVYTQEQNSLEDGQTIARYVYRTVASLLT